MVVQESIKAYVVSYWTLNKFNFLNWLLNTKVELVHDMQDADVVIFTGGEDIDPSIYGEKPNKTTNFNKVRDDYEINKFIEAVDSNLPIVGICRGAQFCCAMSGGTLIQDVTKHNQGAHQITSTKDNKTYFMTSSHHQMMYPYNMDTDDYELLAFANLRGNYYDQYNMPYLTKQNVLLNEWPHFAEPEIVFFTKSNVLAIQGHPEWFDLKNIPHFRTAQYLTDLFFEKFENLSNKQLKHEEDRYNWLEDGRK